MPAPKFIVVSLYCVNSPPSGRVGVAVDPGAPPWNAAGINIIAELWVVGTPCITPSISPDSPSCCTLQ